MAISFRLSPKGDSFSEMVITEIKKLDNSPIHGSDVNGKYVQFNVSDHMLTMPDEFFPVPSRRIIQKELRKVTVMKFSFLAISSCPQNNKPYAIGNVMISVVNVTDYYFVADNINAMIRAILIAKELGQDLNSYISPVRFYSGKVIVSAEIISLKKELAKEKKLNNELQDELRQFDTDTRRILEELSYLRIIERKIMVLPPWWKFWAPRVLTLDPKPGSSENKLEE